MCSGVIIECRFVIMFLFLSVVEIGFDLVCAKMDTPVTSTRFEFE